MHASPPSSSWRRAFANGGSSLTGIEAVSNAVSALRPPEGKHARQILVTQGSIVAFLIAGISWMAHVTHAVPYKSGVPTVVSQEAKLIFGHPSWATSCSSWSRRGPSRSCSPAATPASAASRS